MLSVIPGSERSRARAAIADYKLSKLIGQQTGNPAKPFNTDRGFIPQIQSIERLQPDVFAATRRARSIKYF
jgi:sugar (pentulose or hexulose) kinase